MYIKNVQCTTFKISSVLSPVHFLKFLSFLFPVLDLRKGFGYGWDDRGGGPPPPVAVERLKVNGLVSETQKCEHAQPPSAPCSTFRGTT